MGNSTNQFIDSATTAFFLSDGTTSQNISPSIRNVDFPDSWRINDVTVFGSAGTRYNPSINDSHFRLEMVLNQQATTGSYTLVGGFHSSGTTAPRAFAFYPMGTTTGFPKIYGNCWNPKFTIKARIGDALLADADFDVDNGTTFGTAT